MISLSDKGSLEENDCKSVFTWLRAIYQSKNYNRNTEQDSISLHRDLQMWPDNL